MLGGDDPEYLWWVLLGAPWNSDRLEWIVSGTPTVRFVDPNFHPCAVICTTCSEDANKTYGLPLVANIGGIRLFAAPNPQLRRNEIKTTIKFLPSALRITHKLGNP
jgi:hypothetical protein